jgi:hypothetical protein
VYPDDVNLLGVSINTIVENTQTIFKATGDISLEINVRMYKSI